MQPMPASKDIGNWHAFENHCTLDTDSFEQVCRVNKHGNVEIYRCDMHLHDSPCPARTFLDFSLGILASSVF